MNSTGLFAAVIACLLAGFVAGTFHATPSAEAQMPAKGPVAEYQVELFYDGDGTKEVTRKLNALAAEGWEYAGPIHRNDDRRESTIAFRRAKR